MQPSRYVCPEHLSGKVYSFQSSTDHFCLSGLSCELQETLVGIGDIPSPISKIDQLRDLGVDVVWLFTMVEC